MSVDVEEHFQVSAFSRLITRDSWDEIPSRVEASCDRVMRLFERNRARATFFVLGWVAERAPSLIRRIAEAGHEVASHGYDHQRATAQSPEAFRADVVLTKRLLEDATGERVRGYRAPSFSLDTENLWAWQVLEEAGYEYSSSVYPIHHDHYGLPDAPRRAFTVPGGSLREIPVSTVRLLGTNLPCGGGGYFRLLPYWYSAWAIRRINARDGWPAVFYLHPWELDPGQPRQRGVGAKTAFRHYTNLSRMESRMERLLKTFRWGRMDELYLPSETAPACQPVSPLPERMG